MQRVLQFYIAVKCKCKGGAGVGWLICCGGCGVEELEQWLSWPSSVPVKSLTLKAQKEGRKELKICFEGHKELLQLCTCIWSEIVNGQCVMGSALMKQASGSQSKSVVPQRQPKHPCNTLFSWNWKGLFCAAFQQILWLLVLIFFSLSHPWWTVVVLILS